MGLLRNKLLAGLGWASRGGDPRASSSNRVDFAPLARPVRGAIPEKRSNAVEVGDLKTNFFNLVGAPASSGANVNEATALNVAAVTACVGLLADMVGKLPIYLYRTTPKGPEEIEDHAAIRLIGRIPSDTHTSFELRQLMETGKGLGGNGYARVFRDAFGTPYSIQWVEPCNVTPERLLRPNGEAVAVYRVDGVPDVLTRYDLIHVRGMSRDGICGLSPVRMLRESIGTALSQTQAAGKIMRNGTQFPGIVTMPNSMTPEKLQEAADAFNSGFSVAKDLGRVPFLMGGADFKQTNGMTMVDVQFLESRRFELQEIARLYRIPSFLIGDTDKATSFGTGIEQQTLGFLNFCLDPHLVGWEQSLALTLLTTDEIRKGYYFQFDRDEIANVSLEARANYLQTMRNIGAFSPNDVLRKQGEPLISKEDGGDDYGRPFNASGGTPAAKPEPEPVTP